MPRVLEVIQLLVAPVVMISACGLLALALYHRLAAIVNRARIFARERFEAYAHLSNLTLDDQTSGQAHLYRSRVSSLDRQVDHLLSRAKLVRAALVCLLISVICMLGCSLTLGLSLVAPTGAAALVLFCIGVLVMTASMVLAILELSRALDPVVLEQVETGRMQAF